MDPQLTLDAAQAHFNVGDYDACRASLYNYLQWRRLGGFEPPRGDQRAIVIKDLLDHQDAKSGF